MMPTVSELMSQNNTNAMMNYRLWGNLTYVVSAYDIFPDGTDVTNKLQALVNLANSQGRTAIFFPAGDYYVTFINNDEDIYYFGDNAKFVGGYGRKINQIGSAPTSDYLYSVLDYGAQGNGTTDDTASIQSAIDDCYSKGGGSVLFPTGTYLCGDIILKSKVSLYAFPSTSYYSVENDGVVTLRAKTGSACIIDTSNADGFAINNLYFDGVNKTIDGVSSGGDTGQIHGCKFSRCKIGIGGFKVHYITATSIWNCFFKDNVTGIDNIIDSKIDNNYFYENDIGMALSAGSNALIITNNKFEWNTNSGFNAFQCKNLVISNNIFDRNGQSGLVLDSCDTISVNGNVFIRNGATTATSNRQNHILLAGSNKLTFVGNVTKKAEINDDGSGIMAPRACFYVTGCTDVYFNGDDLTGYTTVLLEEGTANVNFFRLGCIGLMKRGVAQFSGNGTNKVFRITHGFARFPALINVFAASNDAAGNHYFVAEEQDIVVNFITAPPTGTNNILLRWVAEG